MISILVYPNITYQENLEKDSYVVVLHNIIKELNGIRDDIEFTILSPRFIKSLSFPNTRQIQIQLPSYPNQMRTHFNSTSILNAFAWKKNDYDIVYSHLPEHALQLKNLFFNLTNISPVFIGYTHWTEFPEITNYEKTMLAVNLLGLAEMEICGINTEDQKQLILKYARKIFNEEFAEKIDGILEPQNLGWEIPEYTKGKKDPEKIIVFNHRAHKYKRYDWFLKQMDRLRIQRTDFSVWIPLAASCERNFITNEKFDRPGYFSRLSECHVGICAKQLYAGWAVSATDGMSVGIPYLFSEDGYYRELAGDAGIYYKSEDEFNARINEILDQEDLREAASKKSLKRFKACTWGKRIHQFNQMIIEAEKKIPTLQKETNSYKKMKGLIQQHGSITKAELMSAMNWGVRITLTGYRNRLRKDGILTYRDRYEWPT